MFRTGRNQNFPGVSVQETRTVLRALQLGWICCSWLAVPVLLYLNVLVWRGSWAGPPWLAAWLEKNRSPRLTVFQECSQWEGAIPPFENWGAIPQDVRLVSLIFLKRIKTTATKNGKSVSEIQQSLFSSASEPCKESRTKHRFKKMAKKKGEQEWEKHSEVAPLNLWVNQP